MSLCRASSQGERHGVARSAALGDGTNLGGGTTIGGSTLGDGTLGGGPVGDITKVASGTGLGVWWGVAVEWDFSRVGVDALSISILSSVWSICASID